MICGTLLSTAPAGASIPVLGGRGCHYDGGHDDVGLPRPDPHADFVATSSGLGFERGVLVFAGLLALVATAHFFTPIQKSVIFWAAYVLTRPLGATLGDTLTKSHAEGGLGLSRITSALVITAGIVVAVVATSSWEDW